MERRDHLIKQFDALGEALSKLLSKVSLLKEREASDIEIAEIAEIDDLMKSAIGLDLHEIASLSDELFLTNLMEKKLEASDLSTLFLGNYLASNQKLVYFGNIAPLDEARRLLN